MQRSMKIFLSSLMLPVFGLSGGQAAETTPAATVVPYSVPNGVTPEATDLLDDSREVSLSFPITQPGARILVAYRLRTYPLPQLIPAGAVLEYEIRYPADAKWCNGAVELESSPRNLFMLRGGQPKIKDADGMGTHPNNHLAGRAKGKWYLRRLDLTPAAGKPFQNVFLGTEFIPQEKGEYRVAYRRIRILDKTGRLLWNLMPASGELPPAESELPPGGSVNMTAQAIVAIAPEKYLYHSGEATRLQMQLKNADLQHPVELTVNASVLNDAGSVIPCAPQSVTLQPGAETTRADFAALTLQPGNYRVHAEVVIGGNRGRLEYPGFTIAVSPLPLPTAAAIRSGAGMFWGADTIGYPSLHNLAVLREKGGNFINLFVAWSDLEPEEGRYDYSKVDRILADAARANLRVEIFLINGTKEEYPVYTHGEWMCDHQGGVFKDRLGMSYWAKRARPAYMRMLKALVTRYKGDPRVVGYQPSFGGWGDGFYAKPRDGSARVYDYSAFSQEKFRSYLREVLHLSLAEAGKRYGCTYATWDAVMQPEPVDGMDRRAIWWDFQNYRVWTVEQMWDEVCSTIRAIDKDCQIELCYGGSQEATGILGNDYDVGNRIARRYNAIIHNTCYEGYDAATLLGSYAQRWGTLHSCELAGTPAVYPWHQQGMFNVLKFSPVEYCWIGGKNLDGIYPSFPLLRPVAAELVGSKPSGKKLGLLESISFYQLCLKNGAIRYPRVYASQLAARLGLPTDMLTDRSFLGGDVSFDPVTTPVLLLYGEPVLTAESIDAVCRYAEAGGTVVVFPLSGTYVPGNDAEDHALLRRLSLPEAAQLPAPGGHAEATGAGPLAGTRWKFSDVVSLSRIQGKEPVARLSDGSPAIVRWRQGKGTVVLLCGSPDLTDTGTRDAFSVLFRQYGLATPLSCGAGVESTLKQKGETTYAILHNPSADEKTALLKLDGLGEDRVRLTNLLDGVSYGVKRGRELAQGISVVLPGNTTTAIAVEPASLPARHVPVYEYPQTVGVQEPAVIPHESMSAPMIARAAGGSDSRRAYTLPFATTADGYYELALAGTGVLTKATFTLDGQEIKPQVRETKTGWRLIFPIADLPRGHHVLQIAAQSDLVLTGFAYAPELFSVESWRIAGPFANRDGYRGKSFYEAAPPEAKPDFWECLSAGKQEGGIASRPVHVPAGTLNFAQYFPFNPKTMAYAACEITVPRDCALRLDCGVDYAFQLWVNGERVFDSNAIAHGTGAADFGLNVRLRKGTNRLLFKVAPGGLGWMLHLRTGRIGVPDRPDPGSAK